MPSKMIKEYFRVDRLPHIWCSGCGHGILTRCIVKAIEELELEKDKVCIVSGIGCSSRAAGYLDFNTVHTTHGRALAFATGIKMANPNLHVIVIAGDGDITAIGGNHLIHSCRRNIDITTVVFNNNIYGMTGGQYSPTTPRNEKGTTAPYGNIDKSFNICELVRAAGATYIAKSTAYHAKDMIEYVKRGIIHKGFSVIEGISICPTYYGRKNNKGGAVELMLSLKEEYKKTDKGLSLDSMANLQEKCIGEFKNVIEPEYTEEYEKIIRIFKKENDE